MDLHCAWISIITLFACYIFLYKFLWRLNGWYYKLKHGHKDYPLPPGHMGWPLIGNLVSFFKDFSSGHPDSFITNLTLKYGRTGIYKTHLFGSPSVIVCLPELCKKVLGDDVTFKLGYPKSVKELAKCRPMINVSNAEHKHFRRLITAPIVGHKALELYIERLEDIMINSLEELSSLKDPFELFKEMKKVFFKAIVHVFMGSSNQHIVTKIGSLFTYLYNGMFSLPINAPGFTFHKALEARKKLAKIVQPIVDERRLMIEKGEQVGYKKDLMDILLEVKDENDRKLEDEHISDLLIGLLFAGHETTATALMWAMIYLTQHPHVLKKAKIWTNRCLQDSLIWESKRNCMFTRVV